MRPFELSSNEQFTYLHKIEIDITEKCNLSCKSCVRGCDNFKSDVMISLDKIQRFVDESIELNYQWERIGIMGGEPTLHPQLSEIINILYDYHQFNPSCHFWTRSNCIIPFDFPSWIEYQKNIDHSYHHAFYVSPQDVNYPMDKRTCHVLYDCGLMYSYHGYLPCCNSNVHIRAFNLIDGIQSLKNVNIESIIQLCEMYCKHCGWYMMDDFESGHLMEYPDTYMSETWRKAMDRYKLVT
jgi:hypothetical protein